MSATAASILAEAVAIRDATRTNYNSASRVGGLLVELAHAAATALPLVALGCAGDGATDDVAALTVAITANAGKVLDGQGRTYKVNSQLIVSGSGVTVQNAILDLSGCPDSSLCMTAFNSLGTAMNLTADLSYGSRTVTIANTASLAAGRWVLIQSTKSWALTGGGVVGEMARILSVDSATQFTLETPAHSTYTTAQTGSVTLLGNTVSNITFRNCTFIGSGNGHGQRMCQIAYVEGFTAEGCRSYGFDNSHWDLWGCIRARVVDCEARQSHLAGLSYGVVIERGCRDVLVQGCHFSYLRHGVTIGGSGWVNRYVRVQGCHVDYCGDAGLDSHAQGQFIEFIGNTIVCNDSSADWAGNGDGIMMQAADAIIADNVVFRPADSGIVVQNFVTGAEKAPSFVVSGNVVVDAGDVGIYVLNQGQTIAGITVQGNTVRGARGANASMYLYALTGAIFRYTITGNTIADGAATGIFVRGSSNVDGGVNCYDGSVVGNSVQITGLANNGDGVLLLTVKRCVLSGNTIEVTEADRFGINLSSAVDSTVVANDVLLPAGATGYCVQITGTGSGNTVGNNRGLNGAYGLAINNTNTACTIGLNDWSSCTQPMSLGTGAGHKLVQVNEVSADKGNAPFTVLHYSEQTQRWNTPITADRAVTLPSANVKARFRIVRGAGCTGAFNLNVGTGPLKALAAAGTWCDVESDGTSYLLTGSGTL